ncbi:DUF885 domain-containing protein [Brevibacterium samyangense]|uniref:DUF885 domain-containing protein n=1 Tax=Brevibacterium samyangense TaxID=366888 RepID=A0ABP5EKX5_9MICO
MTGHSPSVPLTDRVPGTVPTRTPSAIPTREPSAVDAVAEAHAQGLLDLHPSLHVELGVPGMETELDDLSPAAAEADHALRTRTLAALAEAEAQARAAGTLDEVDEVTLDVMRERLGIENEMHDAGLDRGVLNVIASPVPNVRDFFDNVPTATATDWEHNAARLGKVAQAFAGYKEDLVSARELGRVPALRQVEKVAAQADLAAADGGHFDRFVAGAGEAGTSASLQEELRSRAAEAKAAFADIAAFLRTEVAPTARTTDAVGRDEYALHSRYFLGAAVDLEETYAWGLEELARIDAEQRATAEKLYPGEFSPEEAVWGAMKKLDADPARKIHGLDGLRAWIQETADTALAAVDGVHFDIPDVMRTVEAMVLPNGTGGIYYTPPSSDFSRPGRVWWSVPAGVEEFTTWQERTTVNHEGVPGHHLQFGVAAYLQGTLNTWRRNMCWVSGHGEGWALYSEKFMAEIGLMDEPGDYMGMLDSQRLRASRVALDIGVHLGLPAPESIGGGTWNPDNAWQFLTDNVAMDRSFLAFELDRYLGWPGQAPSYKIGQRLWEESRETARAAAKAAGKEFSLKDFHMRALSLGSVGLNTLTRALVRGAQA